ncbi:MAG: N-succinylarginine dihydrolase, partial [Rickettsiales bacterium]
PEVIDQGVFHNDVIAMNTTRRLIAHTESFTPEDKACLQGFAARQHELRYREITSEELPVADAVASYLFNSQLLDLGGERFVLLAPTESENTPRAHETLEKLKAEGVLAEVHYRDLRESMCNGGGPACLRLRVAMTKEEAAAIHPGVILTEDRYHALKQWVEKHYRDRLHPDDLRDPQLVRELEVAYLGLEDICDLPGLYQKYMQ